MPVLAPAKINLALHVTSQRTDGYHLIDTLVTFADIGDRLTFEPDDDLRLTLGGSEVDDLQANSDNLVLRAANLLRDHVQDSNLGASIHLQKDLPVASGIGGGSADAAATLIGLNRLWNLSLDQKSLRDLALPLGADIPMCVFGAPARVSGIGELIEPVQLPSLALLLVNPRVAVPTPEIFSRLAHKTNQPLAPLPMLPTTSSLTAYLSHQRNDLQLPAFTVAPAIGDCLVALEDFDSCQLTRMSGSGATCFGIFGSRAQAKAAAAQLRSRHPDWWVVDTATV